MHRKQHIRQASIVNEDLIRTGDVLVEDGTIAAVCYGEAPPELRRDADVVEAAGLYLLPGVIDDQVHFREPGLTHKADIASESAAAVAGGVTSFMDMPNTVPPTTSPERWEEKYRAAEGRSHANYAFYFGATAGNAGQFAQLDPARLCGVKLFMGSSTGDMLVSDPQALEDIFAAAPGILAVHCEDEATIRRQAGLARERYGEAVPMALHAQIRSAEACYLSSARAVELARKHGTRLHLLHLSTARELSLLDHSVPLDRKQITGEVCVHHLWFCDADYARYGARIKWNPSIKTEQDRQSLLQAVADGTVDVIGSDHAPHTLAEKSATSYFAVPSGGPLVQHTLNVMLELSRQGAFSVACVVRRMCHAPADLFGIPDRGYIREGYRADLVLVDLQDSYTVSDDQLYYKCGWSPFEGTLFHSRVKKTWVNGRLAFDDGHVTDICAGMPLAFRQRRRSHSIPKT
ncbi:MAG: dihydroorotase [Bacteroidales bacterium]|nr:dihydroorotase [Bacteroidales bacterium]